MIRDLGMPSPSGRGWLPGISAPRWNMRLISFFDLALSTGAASHRAIGFYEHLGFDAEDIKLTKVLD